jgi:hypothetical protein
MHPRPDYCRRVFVPEKVLNFQTVLQPPAAATFFVSVNINS